MNRNSGRGLSEESCAPISPRPATLRLRRLRGRGGGQHCPGAGLAGLCVQLLTDSPATWAIQPAPLQSVMPADEPVSVSPPDLRLRLIVPGGELTVFPTRASRGQPPSPDSAYVAMWIDYLQDRVYLFDRLILSTADVGHALLNLIPDVGVDLLAAAAENPMLDAAISEGAAQAEDPTPWLPAMRPRLAELITQPGPSGDGTGTSGGSRAIGGIGSELCSLGNGPPVIATNDLPPCDDCGPGAVQNCPCCCSPEEPGCGGGGGGPPPPDPCEGSPDPCCDQNDPCCGNPDRCCKAGNPCCHSVDPCCNENDPCCGIPNRCCNDDNPCCGSPDPCCNPDDECCGNPDPCCNPDNPCCGDPCCGQPPPPDDADCDGELDDQDDDDDNDGILDVDENPGCEKNPDPCCGDADCDGIPDGEENPGCENNPDLCCGVTCADTDVCTDDTCDPATGLCVFSPIPGCVDTDGDGIPDDQDTDDDGDGILDVDENPGCELNADPCCGDTCCGQPPPPDDADCDGILDPQENPGCSTNSDPCCGVNCDDNDPCTFDSCVNGNCEHIVTCPNLFIQSNSGSGMCGALYGATFNLCFSCDGITFVSNWWSKETVGQGAENTCAPNLPIINTTIPFQFTECWTDLIANSNGPPEDITPCTTITEQTIFAGPTPADVELCRYAITQRIDVVGNSSSGILIVSSSTMTVSCTFPETIP